MCLLSNLSRKILLTGAMFLLASLSALFSQEQPSDSSPTSGTLTPLQEANKLLDSILQESSLQSESSQILLSKLKQLETVQSEQQSSFNSLENSFQSISRTNTILWGLSGVSIAVAVTEGVILAFRK